MMTPMKTHLRLPVPKPFDFAGTAYSHGWVVLSPNSWDPARLTLQRIERLVSGKVVSLSISSAGVSRDPHLQIEVVSKSRLGIKDRAEITRNVERMFRLDENLTAFYRACRKRGGRWKRLTTGLGRLLRSPTVFEDVVKVICTTNVQWGGTKSMVTGLVDAYGATMPGHPNQHAFPEAHTIAALKPDVFAASVRLGYRAPYVHELAERVASGEWDPEAWRDPNLPTRDLKKQLLAIKGIGPYAAATLLMLLGHYDDLAIDTVCRDFVGKKYFEGGPPSDAQIREVYDDWGRWKFLAYWYDLWAGLEEKL